MQRLIKTYLLILFIFIILIIFLFISLWNAINKKPQVEQKSQKLSGFNIEQPNLNPSAKPGLTTPWGELEGKKIFKIIAYEKTCNPKEIIVQKGDIVELIFEWEGGVEIPGLESQLNFQKSGTSADSVFNFIASSTGNYKYPCPFASTLGNLIIKN